MKRTNKRKPRPATKSRIAAYVRAMGRNMAEVEASLTDQRVQIVEYIKHHMRTYGLKMAA